MRLVSYSMSGGVRWGCVADGAVIDINGFVKRDFLTRGYDLPTAARMASQVAPTDLGDVLAGGAVALDRIRGILDRIATLPETEAQLLRAEKILCNPEEITYLPPLASGATLFCIGRNYAEHVAEAGSEIPTTPALFLRTHNSVVGHRQSLLRPKMSSHFDWEIELAVIIGQHCRYVAKADALKVVAAYSVFNDGSLRDYQKGAPILTAGKNFFHSGAMGPSLVTADEVRDPQALQIRTWLNGDLMQNASTADMIFDVATIIAYITEFTPLRPGDVIVTGTPAGVGFKRKPPRFLKPGDVLKMEIGNLDPLENSVEDEVHESA